MEIYLQGDVVVAPAELPRTARPNGNEVRIASESGNPHILKGRAFIAQGQQYVVLDEPTPLTHPQHPTKLIPAGTYEVRTVRDYMPQLLPGLRATDPTIRLVRAVQATAATTATATGTAATQEANKMTHMVPLELYVPDLNIPSEESLFYRVDITALDDSDGWVRGLEDILSEIDTKHAKKVRRGGKRINVACAKVEAKDGEVRYRVARFIPYPLAVVNRVKRLRSEAYQALQPYMTTHEVKTRTEDGELMRKQHYIAKENLLQAFGSVNELNAGVVDGQIRETMQEFESSRDYERIFSYVRSTVGLTTVPHKVLPHISLSVNPLGVFSNSYRKFLSDKKRQAVEAADQKKVELLKKVEEEAAQRREEVLQAVDGDLRERLREVVARLAELAQEGRALKSSFKAIAKRTHELRDLAGSLGLGDPIKAHIRVIDETARAVLAQDKQRILKASKLFAENCGVTARDDSSDNFRRGIKSLQGGRFFLDVIE